MLIALSSLYAKELLALWCNELRSTSSLQIRRYLRVESRFCATGLFADLCIRHLPQFEWISMYSAGADDSRLGLGAIRRVGESGLDYRGLPVEMRLLIGFSEEQEAEISVLNDEGVPFDQIARFIEGKYNGVVKAAAGVDWVEVSKILPDRNRDPNYLQQISSLSAWGVGGEPVVEGEFLDDGSTQYGGRLRHDRSTRAS